MQPEILLDLRRQKQEWFDQASTLLQENTLPPEIKEHLRQSTLPYDPEFAGLLDTLFQKKPKGQKEFLLMEIDELRRGTRARETEQLFRAFGALTLITPLRMNGKTVHLLNSGPLKISPWTDQEKETLASLCGIQKQELPPGLDQVAIYHSSQIQMLVRQQTREAALLTELLSSETLPQTESAASTPSLAGMDLLQPGFADHLDLLFCTVQKELKTPDTLSDASVLKRIQSVTLRGRHLASHIRQLSCGALSSSEQVSIHAILKQWQKTFSHKQPTLRINLRLEAENDQLTANTQQLQHMLFTLMASVADGLPEGRAIMGLSTRNLERDGEIFLHLEIRDGGGLATFAGVGGETDRQMFVEQNEAAEEFSDWFTLASQVNAELHLLRDEGVVTRAELVIPLQGSTEQKSSGKQTGGHQLWIVEDDDREYESLVQMLGQSTIHCTRFTSATDLRKNFALATEPPDIVLLKYYLPDQRGAEVRSWLFEQDSTLPVILVSGLQATHPGIATANSLPSTIYLQKPFDSQDLLDMVNMNLNDTLAG